MKADIVIIGVGGQGTLLASRILGALAMEMGHDVKVSEVHGMSQRGGSVTTYVRIGDDIPSPMVDTGSADYVVAFEQLEAVRALPYLKKGGTLIASTQKIDPMPVISGACTYPEDLLDLLKERSGRLIAVDALALARQAGSERSVNLVLLGALKQVLGGDEEAWQKAIAACVKESFLAMNLKAFALGAACQKEKRA
ncbi:MAG: indolepyruvate oxidoreductase subunit beta [Candidatus Excrementavichristensenella sp.]|jgi:indolepyruvate ferredoxin oxidoreductase beta subunit